MKIIFLIQRQNSELLIYVYSFTVPKEIKLFKPSDMRKWTQEERKKLQEKKRTKQEKQRRNLSGRVKKQKGYGTDHGYIQCL